MSLKDKFKRVVAGGIILASSFFLNDVKAGEEFIRGDSNYDEKVNISDSVYTLNYLFNGGEKPRCEDALDVNDDGSINISDPVSLMNYLFFNGEMPKPPFPQKGVDLTEDNLECSMIKKDVVHLRKENFPLIIENQKASKNNYLVYKLTEDVHVDSFALRLINSSNVEIDGDGWTIHYGEDINSRRPCIYIENSEGFIFRNLNIVEVNTDGCLRDAFFIQDSKNGLIEGNNIETKSGLLSCSTDGFILESSKNNQIKNNFLNIQRGDGIFLDRESNNNTIEQNIIHTYLSGSKGIDSFSNNMNILDSNNIITEALGSEGLFFDSSLDNIVLRNSITTNGNSSSGIFLKESRGNFLENNILTYGGDSPGMVFYNSSENFIKRNEIQSFGNYSNAFHFSGDSNSNLFIEDIVKSFASKDIFADSSSRGSADFFDLNSNKNFLNNSDNFLIRVGYGVSVHVLDSEKNDIENALVIYSLPKTNFSIKGKTNSHGIYSTFVPSYSLSKEERNDFIYNLQISHEDYKPINSRVKIDGAGLEFILERN